MKVRTPVILAQATAVIVLGACLWLIVFFHSPSQFIAERRLKEFTEAVNYNRPSDIYPLLTPKLRSLISEEEFVQNFKKERSYPYLTPLFVYVDVIDFNEEKTEGEVQMTVASRLPGEKMYVDIVFKDGRYYIDAFEDIADGTFIEKFDRL